MADPKKKKKAGKPAEKKAPEPKKKKPGGKQPAGKPEENSEEKTLAQQAAARQRKITHSPAWFFIVLLLTAAVFFKYGVAGYSFTAYLCLGLAGVIWFFTFVPMILKHSKVVTKFVSFLLTLLLIAAVFTEALIVHASFGSPETETRYLIVLGAKVRADGPSLSLSDRIDAAYDYLTKYPNTIAVVSGGQGADEPMSEAQCMYDSLVTRGISPGRIWVEDRATSTWENLQYSLALIETKTGQRPAEVAVLSSEYHMFRASLFTKAAGAEFIGIPAGTSNTFLKINYFLREVAGVWHYIFLNSMGGHYHA